MVFNCWYDFIYHIGVENRVGSQFYYLHIIGMIDFMQSKMKFDKVEV